MEALAGGAKVREWYEYGGNPYHFRVEQMPDKVRCGGSVEAFTRAIENAKNVRSWLDELKMAKRTKGKKALCDSRRCVKRDNHRLTKN